MTNDPIQYERGDAHTRASFTMPGDVTITGPWSTGDLQATRNLAQVLADRLGDVSELLEASDQRIDRMLSDARPARKELADARATIEDLTYEVKFLTERADGLQEVVTVREREKAAILDGLNRNTVDLLVELAQLRVAADGGRHAAVEQMLKDAVAQREQAEARAAALKIQVEALKDHNKLLNHDLKQAEEKLANPDPWYNDPGVVAEWGTRHTLISDDGVEAEPIVMNMGADQARALERYQDWYRWGLAERVRLELVRRVIIRSDWIPVPVPQTEEVDSAGAVESDDSPDLSAAGER